ncbi:MAG: single-stranded-DNA-specific exonuclease RecJ, partial [Caulobacteraceae bacterium]
GLTIRPDVIPEFRAFLGERLAEESAAAFAADALDIDALISPTGADRALWAEFQRLTPFGPGNPEPMFAMASVRVERPMAVKGGHVRCVLVDSNGAKLRAVSWRSGDTDVGRRLLAGDGALHVSGRLKPDDWSGREGVEFEIEDVADPRRVG